MDGIDYRKTSGVDDKPYSSNSKSDNNSDKDGNNRPAPYTQNHKPQRWGYKKTLQDLY